MDIPSSQPRQDPGQNEKRKINDGASVLTDQLLAIEELKNIQVRKFRYENVAIETLSSEPLITKMWVTDDCLEIKNKKEREVHKCDLCEKTFDKKQKLLLHARFHSK